MIAMRFIFQSIVFSIHSGLFFGLAFAPANFTDDSHRPWVMGAILASFLVLWGAGTFSTIF